MNEFIELVKAAGLPGLIVGLFVLLSVFGLTKGGVTVTSGQKQLANVVLSILLAGVNLLNAQTVDVLVASIASIASALLYELIHSAAKKNASKAVG